jgi:hypothetical protein
MLVILGMRNHVTIRKERRMGRRERLDKKAGVGKSIKCQGSYFRTMPCSSTVTHDDIIPGQGWLEKREEDQRFYKVFFMRHDPSLDGRAMFVSCPTMSQFESPWLGLSFFLPVLARRPPSIFTPKVTKKSPSKELWVRDF